MKIILCLIILIQSAFALTNEQSIFLKAELELKRKNTTNFIKLKNRLKNYPLHYLLEKKAIENNIHGYSTEQIRNFIQNNSDKHAIRAMRRKYNIKLDPNSDLDTKIVKIKAKKQDLTKKDLHFLLQRNTFFSKDAKEILRYAISANILSDRESLQLLDPYLSKKKYTSANNFIRDVYRGDNRKFASLWLKVYRNPDIIFNREVRNSPQKEFLQMVALSRVAKINRNKFKLLSTKVLSMKHTKSFKAKVIELREHIDTIQRIGNANLWLQNLYIGYTPDHYDKWRVLLYLTVKNYKRAIKISKDYNSEHMRFLTGYAYKKIGAQKAAHNTLAPLTKNFSYYGLLASLQLKHDYKINNKSGIASTDVINKARKEAFMSRTLELISLGRLKEAKNEWELGCEQCNDPALLIGSAAIVSSKGFNNWVIAKKNNMPEQDFIRLKFPTKFSYDIYNNTKAVNIDPAWIYGLIRQESAFNSKAYSRVGAYGLMQVMPATGRLVARRNNIRLKNKYGLLEPKKNIHIGTTYMKSLSKLFHDNRVLATASYNAGPGRVNKWLPKIEQDPILWIETIPFTETRIYVKNVLFNNYIYQKILGKKANINGYFKPVKKRRA